MKHLFLLIHLFIACTFAAQAHTPQNLAYDAGALSWHSLCEAEFSHYEIQAANSPTPKAWSVLDVIDGTHDGSGKYRYDVPTGRKGRMYYRIASHSADGAVAYSEVVEGVEALGSYAYISGQTLYTGFYDYPVAPVYLYNVMTGQKLLWVAMRGENTFDISGLSSGLWVCTPYAPGGHINNVEIMNWFTPFKFYRA